MSLGPYALAAVSGLVYSTSFPPHSWSIAAWIALVPLLGACAVLPPRRAAIAGLLWTAATAVGVAGFFPHMLANYFGLSTVPSWVAAFAIIAALHGIWIGAYAAWVAWLVRRRSADPLVLACGWVACEFVRAHGAFGTPWAIAAYSQVGNARIVQLADLGGPSAIGLLLAAVNAVVAALLIPALRGRRPRRTAMLVAAGLAAALIYGEWRLGQTFADGRRSASPSCRAALRSRRRTAPRASRTMPR